MFDKILILGYGRIAEVLYLPYILQQKCKIIICEVNKERHQAIHNLDADIEVVTEIPSAEEEKVCAALNLSPVFLHQKLNVELLEKGWHVFTEKTPADSAAEWKKLIDIADKNKCVIVSAPVSANMKEEEQLEADVKSGVFGEITEIHCEFIGGGPARRGWIAPSRTWMFAKENSIRVDLAPYLLVPVIERIGFITEMVWKSNQYHPEIDVQDTDEKMTSVCGTAEIGIGTVDKAMLTVLVSYRTYVKDVVTSIEIIGSKSKKKYDLNEVVEDGIHSYTRVEHALELLERGINSRDKLEEHYKVITNMLWSLMGGENG